VWHKREGAPAKELKQCWFPGVHQNIGGQAERGGDGEEIGDNTFAWMVSLPARPTLYALTPRQVDNLSGMLTCEEETIKEGIEHPLYTLG